MTQSFDEWFDTTTYRGYVDENDMESAWDAGAQSKQSEIDELRKRVDDALTLIYKEKQAAECDRYKGIDADLIIGIGYELHLILKGTTNEQ